MSRSPFFFSLRWKLAILFGSVFLLMHSIFSYFAYRHKTEDFYIDRKNEHSNHLHIARALTEDSFLVLEQIAEMLSMLGGQTALSQARRQPSFTMLDEKWSQWQLSWGIENIVFFDSSGTTIKSWGSPMPTDNTTIHKVIHSEMPEHRTVCATICFQQTVVPVIGKAKTVGAYGVTRSFADIMIKFKQATDADIGILFPDDDLRETPGHPWPYRLAGLTLPDSNKKLYEHITHHLPLSEFFEKTKTIRLAGATYEVGIAPIQDSQEHAPLFLFINDISLLEENQQKDLQKIWLNGVVSLLGSLALLPILLHYTFSRIARLSGALPLLAEHQYDKFRQRITFKKLFSADYDELDQLHEIALSLARHLESLEQEVRGNTLKLIGKSRELATERDFIRQLIDTAPIIILTQKLNGIILSINQAGIQELGGEERSIKGKIFDLLIPENEVEHHKKLSMLRSGEITGQFQVDGQLISETGETRDISWLHSRFSPPNNPAEAIILTIGVDNSERTLYQQKLLSLPVNDPITGLAGYQQFRDELNIALAAARRYAYPVAVLVFDVDRYEEINDLYGPRASEMMLAWVACRLKDNLRSIDRLSRVRKNVFALLVSHIKTENIEGFAKKLNHDINAAPFSHAGISYRISARIGIAVYSGHGLPSQDLYTDADEARLQAKLTGPGSFHCGRADRDSQSEIEPMPNFRALLEHAIAQDRFVLQYRPVLCSRSSRLHHYECQPCLPQANGEILHPETFLDPAQDLGLAGKIDRIALERALQTLHESERQGKNYRLSINLSGRIFDEPGFYDDMASLVELYPISPNKIILEISEAAAESHRAQAESLIKQLRMLGCGIALDDFGVSFSSFYYLKNLPIDYVKVCGSFIQYLDQNNEDRIFVKALTGVAHTFSKLTVAKSVENDRMLKTLQELDIDLIQGSLAGKPESSI
jgi:diguanylate cyclase (GGDEF)-like protein/PAS domain S-box-containing protein